MRIGRPAYQPCTNECLECSDLWRSDVAPVATTDVLCQCACSGYYRCQGSGLRRLQRTGVSGSAPFFPTRAARMSTSGPLVFSSPVAKSVIKRASRLASRRRLEGRLGHQNRHGIRKLLSAADMRLSSNTQASAASCVSKPSSVCRAPLSPTIATENPVASFGGVTV